MDDITKLMKALISIRGAFSGAHDFRYPLANVHYNSGKKGFSEYFHGNTITLASPYTSLYEMLKEEFRNTNP